MRHIHESLTLPKHPQLLHEINEMSIAIKLHFLFIPSSLEESENLDKSKSWHEKPTWENMVDLLNKCYHAINEQRESPIKY